jgi:hypothetical protein
VQTKENLIELERLLWVCYHDEEINKDEAIAIGRIRQRIQDDIERIEKQVERSGLDALGRC